MEPDDAARVLVVILPRPRDLQIAQAEGWYRLPLARAPGQLAADYLAFYQPAAFGAERWQVRRYAAVRRYQIQTRAELLPAEAAHPRAAERYYRIELGPLAELPLPVPAGRLRRVSFIATSFGQLRRARDVVELFHAPPPPPELWGAGLAGRSIT